MLQCGIGFGLFLVLAAVLIYRSGGGDDTNVLKEYVYDQFDDCEDLKLVKKLVEKHHQQCVDASTNKDGTNVDGDKYKDLMRERVSKDLRAKGFRY